MKSSLKAHHTLVYTPETSTIHHYPDFNLRIAIFLTASWVHTLKMGNLGVLGSNFEALSFHGYWELEAEILESSSPICGFQFPNYDRPDSKNIDTFMSPPTPRPLGEQEWAKMEI